MEPHKVYEQILLGFKKYKANLLQPDYPDSLLERRAQYLKYIPFYFTGNYVMNLIADKHGICPQRLLRVGKHRPEELMQIFSIVRDTSKALKLPVRGESYNFTWMGDGTMFGSAMGEDKATQSPLDSIMETMGEGWFPHWAEASNEWIEINEAMYGTS